MSVPAPASEMADSPPQTRLWTYPLLIVAVGLICYWNSFQGVFIFDDHHDIVGNAHIRDFAAALEPRLGSWRPVVYLSFSVNYVLSDYFLDRQSPWGYHLVNLTVHLLAAFLLFGVVRRTLLLERLRSRYEESANGLALAVTLIWLAHPLQTESVTYLVHRYESIMGLFFLLTLYCVIRGARSPAYGTWWYVAAGVGCALGMLSKEVMIVAPLVILLYDRTFLASCWPELLRQRWPLHAGLVATAGLLAVPIFAAMTAAQPWAGFGIPGIKPMEYLLNEPAVIWYYLRLSFWPDALCIDHGWKPATSEALLVTCLAVLALLALLAATAFALWRGSAWGFVGAWFFCILAPTSSFMPLADLAAERRMYLPLAAVVLAVVCGVEAIIGRVRDTKIRALLQGALLLLVVAGLGLTTVRRNQDYFDQLTMYRDIVAKSPLNDRAHNNLASVLLEAGQFEEAIEHFQISLRLKPRSPDTLRNLGIALARRDNRNRSEAMIMLERALQINPDDDNAHFHLARMLLEQGNAEAAVPHLTNALRSKPKWAAAHNTLGVALWQLRQVDRARAEYLEAARLEPNYAEPHDNLGVLLWSEGKRREAVEQFELALKLNHNLPGPHLHLGQIASKEGRDDDGLSFFRRAVELNPGMAEGHFDLGRLLARQRKMAQALPHLQEAVELAPQRPDFRFGLAQALDHLGRQEAARQEYDKVMKAVWVMATHPDPKQRNGALAVQMARKACEGRENPAYLDILAAAYAETNRFDDAIGTVQQALALAGSTGRDDLLPKLEVHLASYQKQRPIREQPSGDADPK